jgi:adenylylsulfate kinase
MAKSERRGFVLWLMGPTSSGKTTIAAALLERWRAEERVVMQFDGDEVRDWFGAQLGFTAEDRLRVVRTLAHLAAKSSAAGAATIVSALTAHRDARELIAQSIDPLVVAYLECPIAVCATRDHKNLYARARAGEIATVIGFNSPYEPPRDPEIVVNSAMQSVGESVEQIDRYLRAAGYLS